jgi:choline dehydrogenase-like flavoprotein
MYLNIDAAKATTFDAIVIGSGISGGWAAMELCKKGLKVLLLEKGRDVEHVKDYTTANKAPWEFAHGGKLTLDEQEFYKIQNKNYSVDETNKHFYVNEQESPYIQTKSDYFVWARGNHVGGRSLTWGRQAYRWSDLDFEANISEGVGVDWPIRYKDIEPWYDYVEKFIGISGKKESLSQLPDSIFMPPFEMNCVEKAMKNNLESAFSDRKLIHARTTNITEAKEGRAPCQARNQCDQGCPFGAYFSSNAVTLPVAKSTGNFTLRPNSIATKIIYDDASQKAKSVEVLDTETKQTIEFSAKIIFVNASTIPTTMLLLNSTSSRFPTGLGNDSGQLGHHLMTHTKIGISGKMDGFADQYQYGRRPVGVYIPRFRNVSDKNPDFLRGYNYQGGANRSRNNAGKFEGFGADLKAFLSQPAEDWGIGFAGFGEQLPYFENEISLSKTVLDKWGLPAPEIAFVWKENELKMAKDMVQQGVEMFEKMGVKDIKSKPDAIPKSTVHEMGTARMGRDAKTSVLNGFNQIHAAKNVFVTDGSAMTSSSCVNPSLSYMALTARAVDYAFSELKKGNL